MTADARLARRRALLPSPTYPDLPVVEHREVLLRTIRDHQVVVVSGETGSGKSTQLPKLCLELEFGVEGLIGHTQPRRLAARAVSERIAEELGSEIGGAVGYTVRFNDRVGGDTFIKVMTDGILLAEVQRDRQLRAYQVLIIDEAHERSLNIDFLLGYLRRLLPERPDLKVIITSATIDTARFAAHFDGAPVVEVSGRSYPVEVLYRPVGAEPGDDRDQTQAICDAVSELAREGPGDVLVFLSGEREIRDTAEALGRLDLPGTELLPLYARLSAAEQHRVFAPHRGRRVVLATNVAETSLTVPGIVAVVDPGTARISRYNRRTKVQRLPIEPVSQASADQRAGRCGRVAPGTCMRLYSEEDYQSRAPFTDPEILRTSLASVILQMASLRLGDVEAFPFVDPPDAGSIKDGVLLLEELGALEPSERPGSDLRLTKVGRSLARLPVDPRLGRMILEAERHGCVAEVLVITAGLSIQDPRERPADHEQEAAQLHARFVESDSDFLSYLSLWRYLRTQQHDLGSSAFRRLCRREHLHHLRIREWQDLHAQLRQTARGIGLEVRPLADEPDADGIHQALLAGLLSHIGMWDDEKREYRGARESRFVIAAGSALGKRRPKWVMASELVETNRLRARTVAPLQPERIERVAGHLITRSHSEPWWDASRAAAMGHERVSLYGLPIVERRRVSYDRVDPADARRLFLRHALVQGEWDAPHELLTANRERITEVLALEHRVRRDLLVDDDALVDFFDARVPEDVTTGRRFDRWWRDERARNPGLLTYRLDDLIDPGAGPIGADDFPEWVRIASADLPLTYTAEPGAELDGVTVDVPLLLLDQVAAARLDWQVPGLREELVTALIRSLPKAQRRHLGPAGDTAEAVLSEIGPDDGPLLDVLGRALAHRSGEPIQLDRDNLAAVPAHLRVTYRALDDAGRPLAWSKDLDALRAKLADRVRSAAARAAPVQEVTGQREWTFGAVPRVVETRHAGGVTSLYPALVDEGDTVGLRLFSDRARQVQAMTAGTRRLLLLGLRSPLRAIDRGVSNAAKLALSRSERLSAAAVYLDAAGAAIDHLVAEAGGPAWDQGAFEALAGAVRAGFAAAAVEAVTVAAELAEAVAAVEERLSRLVAPALDETVVDVQAHLARLLRAGFVTEAGIGRLPDLVRYVRAIDVRLDKAAADPARDRARLAPVRELERAYLPLQPLDHDGTLRSQLEELRVATFAQALGVKGKVSERRVREQLTRLAD